MCFNLLLKMLVMFFWLLAFERLHLFAADCRVPGLSCQEERTRNYEDNKQINSHPTPQRTILGYWDIVGYTSYKQINSIQFLVCVFFDSLCLCKIVFALVCVCVCMFVLFTLQGAVRR